MALLVLWFTPLLSQGQQPDQSNPTQILKYGDAWNRGNIILRNSVTGDEFFFRGLGFNFTAQSTIPNSTITIASYPIGSTILSSTALWLVDSASNWVIVSASFDLLPNVNMTGKNHGDIPYWDSSALVWKPTPQTAAGGGGFSSEDAQDAVIPAFIDTDTMDFFYDDSNNQVYANIKIGSITPGLLDTSYLEVKLVTANYVAKGDGSTLTTNNSTITDDGSTVTVRGSDLVVTPSGSISKIRTNNSSARFDWIADRTGINTSHLITNATGDYIFAVNGLMNIGIGTNSQKNKLDIEGSMAIGSSYSGSLTAPNDGLIVQGNAGFGVHTNIKHPVQVTGNVFSSEHFIGAVTMGAVDDATNAVVNIIGNSIGTTSLIDITYQPSTNDIDFAVDNNSASFNANQILSDPIDDTNKLSGRYLVYNGNSAQVEWASPTYGLLEVLPINNTANRDIDMATHDIINLRNLNIGNATGTGGINFETGNQAYGYNTIRAIDVHFATTAYSALQYLVGIDALTVYNNLAGTKQRAMSITGNGDIIQINVNNTAYSNVISPYYGNYFNTGYFSIGTSELSNYFHVRTPSASSAIVIDSGSAQIGLPLYIHSATDGTEDRNGKIYAGRMVWKPEEEPDINNLIPDLENGEEFFWAPGGGSIAFNVFKNENAGFIYLTQLVEYTGSNEGTFYPRIWNYGGKRWVAYAQELQ